MKILRQVQSSVFAVFLSVDLLASAFTGGEAYETISARLGRAKRRNERAGIVFADVVDWGARVFFGQINHCHGALVAYEARLAATAEIG